MFNKLRFKLTLTNVIVVSIIFLTSTSSIFFMMKKIAYDQIQQFIDLVSINAGLNINSSTLKHKNQEEFQLRYFYVKFDVSGNILAAFPDIKNDKIKSLSEKVLKSSKNDGKIKISGASYMYKKNINNNETFIICVNTHPENEMLENLLFVLSITGVISLAFAFLGSLYIANKSLIPIKQSWKRQRDFVADASHELRTPLSVIETTLDLLANKKKNTIESQLKWIENIQAENKRMSKLVNDMLFLARTDSDQVLLEIRKFLLNSALLEAYIPFEVIALQKGIYIEEFKGSEAYFYGDESKIKQLIVILIDNAIKYTPIGGRVGMSLRDTDDTIEIIIEDTGVGIDKLHIDKVFQRFYRVDKSRSRKEGSVGLGLAIADWIVNEHHGSIKVESTKELGTTFTITFPKLKNAAESQKSRKT
jgi:two-component system, OmpR family, sensor histidine kinase CiaH